MNEYVQYLVEAPGKFTDKIAIVDREGTRETDYSTIGDWMLRTASWLHQKQFSPGLFIPVRFEASAEFAAAVCGVWIAGHAAVPMGLSFPPERVEYIAENCDAPLIIDDTVWPEILSTEPLDVSVFPDTPLDMPAFLLYTSGSTGMPKGILHTFAGLLANRNMGKSVAYAAGQRWALGAPMYFVASVVVYKILAFGGCVHLLGTDLMRDVEKLEDYYETHSITVGFISPSVLSNFHNRTPSLKLVMTGSERLTGQCSRDGYKLFNNYGMSETMGTVCSFLVDRPYDTTPVGIPPEGSVWALLDDEGNPVPDGEEGEFCTKGPYTIGYFKDPAATEKLFRGGWLHTGDILKKLPDGNLVYINRKDWMVKINGQRVEPGEIENVLRAVPGVTQAVVKAVKAPDNRYILCAYYTGEKLEESFLTGELSKKLSSYMVPSFYMWLEAFPLNQNGKIDRKILPQPDLMSRRAAYAPPENERQEKIVDAFESVLGIANVGIDDDFFSLGGDSIKVMKLQKALRERGIDASAQTILETRTPRLLSAAGEEPSALAAFEGHDAEAYPLTKAQMTIYLDCQTPGKETAYNNLFGLFLPADMDADAERLQRAVREVVNRYPVLRARTIVAPDGMPSLVPSKTETVEVPLINAATTDRKALAQRLNTPFDLENDLPCRAAVFRMENGLFLAFAAHHIVCDGTSMSLLAQNIARAYNGEEIAPEDMSNLTLAQYEAENVEALEADADVYRKMLDGMEGDTELYADDNPALRANAGKLGSCHTTLFTHQADLSGSLSASLSAHRLTESSLFMGAYAYLLRLLTNQKGVLFFAGENGRHDPVLQNTVGMMVHNVPVFVNVDESADCAAFMGDMQSRFHDLVSHDGADFAALCGEYGILPDCFFVYQGDMLSGVTLGGRILPMEFYPAEDVMTSLTLHVLKQKDGDYALVFEYAAEKFAADTVARMAQLYARIVAGLCAGGKLGEIRLADDAVRAEIDGFNRTEMDIPVSDIVSLFRAAAEKFPDNTAVIFRDKALTYRETDEVSERIAGYLRKNGVGKGSVVSILIPRCEYMTLASLGVLKSGAAYQPLDPSYPPERLAFMMQDADCGLLIADESLLERVPEYRGPVLLTKDIPSLPACEKIPDTPAPEDLFILLYTSGSTGTPKGVMLEHRNLANFCGWFREYFRLEESSRVAAYASYGFDADMMDQYPALTTGACVCIVEEEIRLDLLAMEAWFNHLGITHSFMTTQVGRQFYSMAAPEKLQYLSVGGEKLVPLPPKAGNPALFNGYGPTECTILSSCKRVDRLYERVPIGKALGNYKLYVMDENRRLLPPLVPGELLIAGRGVGRGYLNRPELTEKVFIRNPFSEDPDYAHAYRTGDVVRMLPDGEIDFIGRNDSQVKVRGFRIELTEVESVIREFPGITDATVQAFEDEGSGEKYIAAYVVSAGAVDVPALNAFILERKPPYMVPAVTMQLDAIPLNQNQKVNKKALPKPLRQKAETVPPQNETQQKIFDCVADVVGHTDFGITTNIYEAGLSSIGAIRLNVLLSKAFDATVASKDLKANDTVEKLEAFLTGGAAKAQVYEARAEYGLTRTQEGVYVECVARPNETIYNIPLLLEISPSLDLEKLRTAIVAAVNAHPILKTRLFLNDDGDVRMRRMDADFSFDESCIPVREIGEIEKEKKVLIKPFKLLGGRLFRAEILRGKGLWLFLETHHIISDGSSLAVLLNDISLAYAGETPEAESFTGYEVVLREEELRAGSAFDEAKAYYEKLLEDAETVNLPAGDMKAGLPSRTANLHVEGAMLPETFAKFCEENKCSMNGLFSAAFGLALDKYLGVDAAVFAGIYSGRNDSRLSNTVAMLVKTLPIVVTQRPGVSCADLVREVTRQLSDSQNSDIYSFAEISRSLHVNADVMFAWQGQEFIFDSLCGAPAKMMAVTLSEAKAPINLNVYINNGKILYAMEYRSDRYSEAWMRGFIAAVDRAVNGLVKCPWVEQVSILSKDAAGLLRRFNDTFVDGRFPAAPELFTRAVQAYGSKTAVIARSGAERLTYAELGERAGKVAAVLVRAGVQPGDRVALYMDRVADVYAVRQGIMRAGGAFVSLEPEYPDDRIAYILKDADITRLVTEKETYAPRAALFEAQPGLEVMNLEEIYAAEAQEAPLPQILPDSPAYCIYTSGSTGNPKGVVILHRNLANLLHDHEKNTLARAYLDPSSTWLALAAITFDVSIIEEMMPIFHGRTVSIATQEEIHNPLLLMRTVRETGVDMMKCTPSYLQSILDVPEAREALSGLKALIVGAEPFPAALYERIRAAGFNGTLFNSYGPTETCVSVCVGMLDGGPVNIGGPTLNTAFLIRDKFGNELPPFARGELVIAGSQVGAGYVNLPEQTKEKFIQVTVADRTVNAYRSGDIAYFTQDGVIIHCGRNDNQVKIRGLRIELDGIENVMNSFPGIKRSVVLVKGEGDGRFLCGYYVSEEPVDEAALVKHMKQTLTGYMIPGVFVHLSQLPMTVNGKVNKKALPEPAFKQKERSAKPAATPLQKQLAEMFAKALGLDSVGVDEDFFEIGGTSMLASKVAMQAMVARLPIAYKDVFAFPTVEALEQNILSKGDAGIPATIRRPEPDASGVEIDAVRPALEHNTMAHVREITTGSLGTILLTGATGFLGIHVLRELLEQTDSAITCLVRRGRSETAQKRLESMLVYYFETNYRDAFESGRLRAVNGDITDREIVLEMDTFDTVINCAACVKHFASDDILDRVNVQGVKNLIALCEKTDSRLIQISTVSVAGENVNHALPDSLVLRENMLYFGQDLSNQYVKSKFEAEVAVLREVAAKKLRAKIIRVGNLMSRSSDGEFQVNSVTSGFMRNLKGYAAIGAFPVSAMAHAVEFSPIDLVAKAVRLLAGTPDPFTVFQAVNGHWIEMGDVIAAMNAAGIPVDVVKEEEFSARLSAALQDDKTNMLVSGLISYLSSDADTVRSYVPEDHTFTKNALYRLGYRWPLTDERYLTGAIEALMSLDFFSGEEE